MASTSRMAREVPLHHLRLKCKDVTNVLSRPTCKDVKNVLSEPSPLSSASDADEVSQPLSPLTSVDDSLSDTDLVAEGLYRSY